jgi:hypothetical protein
MTLRRSNVGLANLIIAPHVQDARGAVCMTCGRLVDEETLVEGYPGQTTYFKYLVRHHGGEELRTFDTGSVNWSLEDIPFYVRRTNWFDPTSHEGMGLGKKQAFTRDHDGGDDPNYVAKPLIVVPK